MTQALKTAFSQTRYGRYSFHKPNLLAELFSNSWYSEFDYAQPVCHSEHSRIVSQ